MASPNSTRAAAQIRSLAGLDVGGLDLLPQVLECLAQVLSFDSAAYIHLDERGSPQVWSEDADVLAMVPLYLSDEMQAVERSVVKPFERAAREDFGPKMRGELNTVPWAQFERSDYFNLLLRPLEIHDCVSLITRLPDGRPTGAFKFYRRSRWAEFRRDELAPLARLEPFLASATRPHAPFANDLHDAGERALLVMTPEGRLLWLSAAAERVMARAFGRRWHHEPALPDPLRRVLAPLQPRRAGSPEPALPRVEWRDARGSFVAEARRLEAAQGTGAAVAIELTQHTPRRVRQLRRLARLPLPTRQFEIACWLTGPHSEPQIAAELGISLNTLVYHRRRLYERLAVHSRRELHEWLTAPPA